MVRFTDYGLEMYESVVATQKEWEAAPIIHGDKPPGP